MAARRLVIAMVVLLAISTMFAILAPQRDVKSDNDPASGATGATGTVLTSGESGPTGESGSLRTSEEDVADSGGEIVTATVTGDKGDNKIPLKEGDRLILTVELGKPARIAIPGMGLTGNTTTSSPATFDLLATGDFPQEVVDVDSGEVLASIVIDTKES